MLAGAFVVPAAGRQARPVDAREGNVMHRTLLTRAIRTAMTRPAALPPLDSTPAAPPAAAPAAGADAGAPAGGDAGGQAPPAAPADTTAAPPPAGNDPADLFIVNPPAGATGGSGDLAPSGVPADGAASDQHIAALPPWAQKVIKDTRAEAAEQRVKAKNAEDNAAAAAEERLKTQQEEWVGNLLKAAGLMPDVGDQAAAQLTPEQQIAHLSEQLSATQAERQERDALVQQRDTTITDLRRELAIWQTAHEHDADPQRLTDSRDFMRAVGALDPSADNFADQLSAALGTAIEKNSYFKRAAAQAAPTAPPVPSGADGFAGGPGRGDRAPQSIDEHRVALRKARGFDAD